MMSLRSLACALAIVTMPVPALAAPTALDVVPPDTVFAIAARGIGQIQPAIDAHAKRMVELGLEDPGADRLWKYLRGKLSRLRLKRGPLAPALGLAADGSIAIYSTKIADEELTVVALDVSDRSALIRTVALIMEEGANPGDGKAAKVRIQRTKLPAGGLAVTFTSDDASDTLHARFHGSIAAFSDETAALDRVPFAGGAPFRGMEVLTAPGAEFGFFVGVSLETGVRVQMFPPPAMTVPFGRYHGVMKDGTFETELMVTVADDISPFLAVLKPGSRGAGARAAMAELVTESSDIWARFSYDLEGVETLAKNLLGAGFKEIEEGFKGETALELKTLVEAFTGDHLFQCNGSLSTCTFSMGVGDRESATHVFRHFFALAGDGISEASETEVTVDTRVTATPRRGHQRYTTTFSIPWDLGDDDANGADASANTKRKKKRRKKRKAADLRPVVSIHWGVSDNLVIFSMAPQTIDAALSAPQKGAATAPALVALAGEGLSLIAGYQAAGDVGDFARQLLPMFRGLLPARFEAGVALRVIDALVMSHDHLVDAASSLLVEDGKVTLRGVSHALPEAGQPDYEEGTSKAFDDALRARYAGDIARSNRLMARLAFDHSDTPWGRKAGNLVFTTEGFGPLIYGAYVAAMLDSPGSERMMEQFMREIFGIDVGGSSHEEEVHPHPAHIGH